LARSDPENINLVHCGPDLHLCRVHELDYHRGGPYGVAFFGGHIGHDATIGGPDSGLVKALLGVLQIAFRDGRSRLPVLQRHLVRTGEELGDFILGSLEAGLGGSYLCQRELALHRVHSRLELRQRVLGRAQALLGLGHRRLPLPP
jgi:hypothetical protein